jgi:hypothetical protein
LELTNEISLYQGELTAQCLVSCISDIKKAFPSLPVGFYDILTDRLADNGFSNDRLTDAVRNVIDTCIYPTPTIAQFISFDKRVKTYTYLQYCDIVEKGGDGKNYKAIKLKGRPVPVWIHINDVEQYNIVSE